MLAGNLQLRYSSNNLFSVIKTKCTHYSIMGISSMLQKYQNYREIKNSKKQQFKLR